MLPAFVLQFVLLACDKPRWALRRLHHGEKFLLAEGPTVVRGRTCQPQLVILLAGCQLTLSRNHVLTVCEGFWIGPESTQLRLLQEEYRASFVSDLLDCNPKAGRFLPFQRVSLCAGQVTQRLWEHQIRERSPNKCWEVDSYLLVQLVSRLSMTTAYPPLE